MSALERGQTPHDFALGMGVFLLTVAFVFSTLPGLVEPFERDVTAAESTTADRVAATTVDHLSAGDGAGALDSATTAEFFRANASDEALRRFFGLDDATPVTVTLRNGTQVVELTDDEGATVELRAGDALGGRASATTVRVVTFTGETHCAPTCRLVVEVG